MPNILKRPMFRRGGSAAEGTGITSGLRQNYAEAGSAFPLIEARYKQMLPTQRDSIGNFIAALGATAPKDPTKLQSVGQVLSRAGTTAAGLTRQQSDQAEQFKSGAIAQVIKNMSAADRDILMRRAKKYAEVKNITKKKAIEIFLDNSLKGASPYLKGDSPANRIIEKKEKLQEEGLASGQAQRVAQIEVLFEDGKLPAEIQDSYEGFIDPELIITNQDDTVTIADGAKDIDVEEFILGRTYVNPNNGKVYKWDGATFTKVYPEG